MAQLVLGVAGAVVGGMFGAPQLGWAIGAAIGGMFAPTQKSSGPRLTDLKVTASEYGAPIPYIVAHPRVAGTVVWASDKREISTTTRQGKGGGAEMTTYSYEIDLLIMLSDNPIVGVRRIWSSGALVWSSADESDDDTISASEDATSWRAMRVHTGAQDQLPDPTYEAAVGAGNAPAYRGRGTLMLEGLQLGNGGQLPNLTFEIFTRGVAGSSDAYREDYSQATGIESFGYVLQSGSLADFELAPIPTGTGLLCRSRYNTQVGRIRKAIPITAAARIAFDVCVTNPRNDDAGILELYSGATRVFSFNARRELSVDAAGRSTIAVGPGRASIAAATLEMGVWYRVEAAVDGAAEIAEWTIRSGATVVASGTVATPAFSVDAISYTVDETAIFSETSEVIYADIEVGSRARALQEPERLDDVVRALCVRSGIDASLIDAAALQAQWVHAMAIQPASIASVLQQLATAYYFECVESDKLYFRRRGGAPVATIPYAHTGAEALLTVEEANDLELPSQVNVTYLNLSNAYQQGNEVSDRLTTDSTAVSNVQLAMGLTPAAAKAIADTAVLDQTLAARTLRTALDARYAALEPTDVVVINDSAGLGHRARVIKVGDAAGVRSLDLVTDDARVLRELGITGDDYDGDYTVVPLAATDLAVLDIPLLRDRDDNPGVYVAGDGLRGRWPGYLLARDGVQLGTVTTGAAMGVVAEAMTDWQSLLIDESNALTVTVNPGDQLVSITHAEMAASTLNYAAIGAPGRWEIVQYQRAQLLADGVYRVSGLARGRLGTEHLRGTHAAGDHFVALDGNGMQRDVGNLAEIGLPRTYTGTTLGARADSGTVVTITPTWQGLRPLSPVGARQLLQASGDIAITWGRRSRYVSNVLLGVMPLAEAAEAYEVDIFDGASVVRTLTASTTAVNYTQADQVADFGAPVTSVAVRIYQISASVGRGQPASI